jgi:hypothetical protein
MLKGGQSAKSDRYIQLHLSYGKQWVGWAVPTNGLNNDNIDHNQAEYGFRLQVRDVGMALVESVD